MNEEIQVQFDRYYEGGMSADEKSTFSARLESDTEWKNQYQDYLNAREILEIRAEQDLRDNLKNLEANTKSTGFNKFWILATVITATLIMS